MLSNTTIEHTRSCFGSGFQCAILVNSMDQVEDDLKRGTIFLPSECVVEWLRCYEFREGCSQLLSPSIESTPPPCAQQKERPHDEATRRLSQTTTPLHGLQ